MLSAVDFPVQHIVKMVEVDESLRSRHDIKSKTTKFSEVDQGLTRIWISWEIYCLRI